MNAYGGLETQLHSFLISTASRHGGLNLIRIDYVVRWRQIVWFAASVTLSTRVENVIRSAEISLDIQGIQCLEENNRALGSKSWISGCIDCSYLLNACSVYFISLFSHLQFSSKLGLSYIFSTSNFSLGMWYIALTEDFLYLFLWLYFIL
jgi:hypothetical protein